jgi:hypothetical protein
MGAHSKRTTQRRTLRLIAAGAAATGVLMGSVYSAGASYIPDVLHLGPDTGHRFDDDGIEYLDDDEYDTFIQRLRDALDKVEQQQLDSILNGDDVVTDDLVEPPAGGWHAPDDWFQPSPPTDMPPPPPAQISLHDYFSLEWGWDS